MKRDGYHNRLRGWLTLSPVWIIGWASLNGCMVKGFQTIPDGPTSPQQLRAGATIARAEADALDRIADEQEGAMRRVFETVQQGAEGLGAPALVTGLIGGASGLLIPSPAQRRREKLAIAEAKAEAKTEAMQR